MEYLIRIVWKVKFANKVVSINKILNLTKVNVPTHLPNEYGPNVQYIQVYTFNNIHIYIHTTYLIIALYLDTQQVGLVIEIYPHLIQAKYSKSLQAKTQRNDI